MSQVRFISYLKRIGSKTGHSIPYNIAFSSACESIGYGFVCGTRRDEPHPILPFMHPELSKSSQANSGRSVDRISYASTLQRYLTKQIMSSDCPIVFSDWPTLIEMLVLLSVFHRIKKRDGSLWLMIRRAPTTGGAQEKLFRCFIRYGKRVLGEKFVLVTDSDSLAADLSERWCKTDWTVLPIPHVGEILPDRPMRTDGSIDMWWAGFPRPEKGLDIVQHIAASTGPSVNAILTIPESVPVLQGNPRLEVCRIPESISGDHYGKLLSSVDLMLLPYNPQNYWDGTSGIFTESMCAGCLPVVTQGTWMADQLARLDLDALVMHTDVWRSDKIIDQLLSIAQNTDLRSKFNSKRRLFAAQHGLGPFSAKIEALVAQFSTS